MNPRSNKKSPKAPVTTEDSKTTLSKFVIHARRVASHSMVKSGEVQNFTSYVGSICLESNGTLSLKHQLPNNPEIMESLAGRLRPFIVHSESIFIENVFDALDILLPMERLGSEYFRRLVSLKDGLRKLVISQDAVCYRSQVFSSDDESLSCDMSDLEIALAWLYMDYVHVDPNRDRAQAAELPYEERYLAATRFFCSLSILIIELADLVKDLCAQDFLPLSDDIWTQNVIAPATQTNPQVLSKAYIAAVGTEAPITRDLKEEDGFIPLSPQELQSIFLYNISKFIMKLPTSQEGDYSRLTGILMATRRQFHFMVESSVILSFDTAEIRTDATDPQQCVTLTAITPVHGREQHASELLEKMTKPDSVEMEWTSNDTQHRLTYSLHKSKED